MNNLPSKFFDFSDIKVETTEPLGYGKNVYFTLRDNNGSLVANVRNAEVASLIAGLLKKSGKQILKGD
jgi:hypothetical protein